MLAAKATHALVKPKPSVSYDSGESWGEAWKFTAHFFHRHCCEQQDTQGLLAELPGSSVKSLSIGLNRNKCCQYPREKGVQKFIGPKTPYRACATSLCGLLATVQLCKWALGQVLLLRAHFLQETLKKHLSQAAVVFDIGNIRKPIPFQEGWLHVARFQGGAEIVTT